MTEAERAPLHHLYPDKRKTAFTEERPHRNLNYVDIGRGEEECRPVGVGKKEILFSIKKGRFSQ